MHPTPPQQPIPALIDAGNTAIKLYQLSPTHATPTLQLLERCYRPVSVEAWCHTLKQHNIHTAHWVSSWPEEEQQQWQDALTKQSITLHRLSKETFLPRLPHWHYATEELGLDRIMGITAVYSQSTPHKGVILISAGTATCVEFITKQGYHGGWIQPGLRAWCDAMKHPAPHLPTFEAPSLPLPETPFGHDTASAVLSGLVRPYILGLACSISNALAQAGLGQHWRIVSTGGHAPTLRRLGLIEALSQQATTANLSVEDGGDTPDLLPRVAFEAN
jgi:pantothenate kinase type III